MPSLETTRRLGGCPPLNEDLQPWLADQRIKIDRIDQEILRLLNIRARCAGEIANRKKLMGLEILAPGRESAVMNRLCLQSRGPLETEAIRSIYGEIISVCRGLQGPFQISVLGPDLTHSHLAAKERFGSKADVAQAGNFAQVFEQVEAGNSQVALVPVENCLGGVVWQVMNQLMRTHLKICGEHHYQVRQVLATKEKSHKDLWSVISHPQGFEQCRNWLNEKLPRVELREASSTSEAARLAALEPRTAAICSKEAAQRWGLRILTQDVQNRALNLTRFLMLSRDDCPPSGRDITSLVVTAKDCPQAMERITEIAEQEAVPLLQLIPDNQPNLMPTKNYYVEIAGHYKTGAAERAVERMKREAHTLRVLGAYPKESKPN